MLGHDGIHGFWFKKFTPIHDRLAVKMNSCLPEADIPEWMTKGKTILIQKDPLKGTVPNNYRPIMCLPITWKIHTEKIREEIYDLLTSRRLFLEEQKGCHKGSRGTGELLYTDQHILDVNKVRQKNLAMAWIDYKRAFDMVQQSWIINYLKMYKISDEIIKSIEKIMKIWRVEFDSQREKLSKYPENYIPGRCAITTTICNSDDAIQPHTQKMYRQIKNY